MNNDNNFLIVLLSGKARSGKNTVINYLKDELEKQGIKTTELMIAKTIKDYAKEHFGWDGREETKPRTFLQDIGNHIRFDLNMPNLLIERCCQDANILSEYIPTIFVSDCRFRQELAFFKAYFPDNLLTIRLEREGYESELDEKQRNHITEIDLDGVTDWDYIISSPSGVDELYKRVNDNDIINVIKEKLNKPIVKRR